MELLFLEKNTGGMGVVGVIKIRYLALDIQMEMPLGR